MCIYKSILVLLLFLQKNNNYTCEEGLIQVIVVLFLTNVHIGILAHHDKVQLQEKGHYSENYSFGVLPHFNWKF